MFSALTLCFFMVSAFRVVNGQETCGGLLTDPSGEFSSPDLDGDFKYDNNMYCVWTITANLSQVIDIQFYYVELEDSAGCLYDYVEVFDGDALVDRYCGTVTPPIITSGGNTVTVIFRSDPADNFYGFGIVYFIKDQIGLPDLCGAVKTSFAGALESVDHDLNGYYDNNVTCSWKIRVLQSTRKIQLYFLKLALQQSDDCILDHVKVVYIAQKSCGQVYDARSDFGTFCGTELPPVFTSTANELFVEFSSDDSINDAGFLAVYTAIDTDLQCGRILTDPAGVIFSPDNDGNGEYDENLNCIWIIVSPENTAIRLDFNDIIDIEDDPDGECAYDYLQLFDGAFDGESSPGRICGSTNLPTVLTTTNVLYIEFHSDDSLGFGGFSAFYSHILKDRKYCGPGIIALAGQLESFDSDGDGFYDHDVNCTWKIIAVHQKRIEFYIQYLDIPSTKDCSSGHLKIYDDNTTYAIFCGTKQQLTIISASNILYIDVVTDGSVNGGGFNAFYTLIDKEDNQCGGILYDSSGSIKSLDRDGDGAYDSDLDCVWVILAPSDKRIVLEILELALEAEGTCSYDFLQLYDGDYSSEASVGRLCTANLSKTLVTNSNVCFVEFHTDHSVNKLGFYATYRQINASEIGKSTVSDITTGTYASKASILSSAIWTSKGPGKVQTSDMLTDELSKLTDDSSTKTVAKFTTRPSSKRDKSFTSNYDISPTTPKTAKVTDEAVSEKTTEFSKPLSPAATALTPTDYTATNIVLESSTVLETSLPVRDEIITIDAKSTKPATKATTKIKARSPDKFTITTTEESGRDDKTSSQTTGTSNSPKHTASKSDTSSSQRNKMTDRSGRLTTKDTSKILSTTEERPPSKTGTSDMTTYLTDESFTTADDSVTDQKLETTNETSILISIRQTTAENPVSTEPFTTSVYGSFESQVTESSMPITARSLSTRRESTVTIITSEETISFKETLVPVDGSSNLAVLSWYIYLLSFLSKLILCGLTFY